MDFSKTWHTYVKNCFLLTALLLESLEISFTRVKSILKEKNGKKTEKNLGVMPLKVYHTCCFHGDISITKNSS